MSVFSLCHCYVCLVSGCTLNCLLYIRGDWWGFFCFCFFVAFFLCLSVFFSAGFQCLSLLLLPPCPSWLHRYLWLALWPGCRRAVSEEAKTYFPPDQCQLLPFPEHPACLILVLPLPFFFWEQIIPAISGMCLIRVPSLLTQLWNLQFGERFISSLLLFLLALRSLFSWQRRYLYSTCSGKAIIWDC